MSTALKTTTQKVTNALNTINKLLSSTAPLKQITKTFVSVINNTD